MTKMSMIVVWYQHISHIIYIFKHIILTNLKARTWGTLKKIPPYPIFSFEVGESRLCISVILRFKNSCNGVELLPASDNDIVRSVVKLDRKVTTVDVSEMVERNDLPTGWLTTCLLQILECTNRMKENRLNERALVKEHSLRNFDNVSMRARS